MNFSDNPRTGRAAGSKIAILGWGSLLWSSSPAFDQQHGPWELDGPVLPLEFSRASQRWNGALTLVIDPVHGVPAPVAWTLSHRGLLDDAVADLRNREATNHANIGFLLADGSRDQARDARCLDVIRAWAKAKSLDAVVWTDLASNFADQWGESFGVQSAIEYLETLPDEGRAQAVQYVRRAPRFIDTPLRRALEAQPWFQVTG